MIKLYMYSWKYGVQTSINRCKWVRMGVYGCVGAQGYGGDTKTRKTRGIGASKVMNDILWPGKFPQT